MKTKNEEYRRRIDVNAISVWRFCSMSTCMSIVKNDSTILIYCSLKSRFVEFFKVWGIREIFMMSKRFLKEKLARTEKDLNDD